MEMTIKEAADHLGVSTKTIRGKIKRGDIPVARREPCAGGWRYILSIEDEVSHREPQGAPNRELVMLLMAQNAELQEKVASLEREVGQAQGRGYELEKQIRLLAGPRPGLVERVKKAIWGAT